VSKINLFKAIKYLVFAVPFFVVPSIGHSETANIYTAAALDAKEKYLTNLAEKLNQYQFVPLKAGNTTPSAWIIKNSTGTNVGLLKCTSGNNFAQAEIATYSLGRLLNFPVYPVTIGADVSPVLAKQLGITPQVCALKEWLDNWSIVYWKAQANIAKIVKEKRYDAYKAKNTFLSGTGDNRKLADTLMGLNDLNQVKNDSIRLSSNIKTRNGSPLINNKPTYFTSTPVSLLDTARDLSNIMVLDAVIGNGDRFPGLNLEMRSAINKVIIKDKEIVVVQPRFSSLDTGLSFKGWQPTWGRLEVTYYLRRFDPEMIKRLTTLLKQLNQLTPADLATDKWSFLNFKTQINSKITARDYLITNIKWVLDFVKKVETKTHQEFIPDKTSPHDQAYISAYP